MRTLSTKNRNALTKTARLILLMTTLILGPLAQAEEKPQPAASPAVAPPPPSPAKQEAIDSIDARIQNLQNTRDCINQAQSHQVAEACRAKLKRSQNAVKNSGKKEDVKK